MKKSIPKELDVVIIDGFFYLYTLRDIPIIFGAISHNLLCNLTIHAAREVHVIFDTYPEPSIKDYEHSIRDNLRNYDFFIEGPQTKRPSNFIAELKNIKFKQAFVQFLINDWSTLDKALLFKPTQKVFLNYQLCHSYRKLSESVVKEVSEKYTCSAHEEADKKIVYQVCAVGPNTNILIKCSDTDILIILLSNIKQFLVHVGEDQFNEDRKIWMQLGTGNNVKNIDICAVYDLDEKLCSSLAAFHAFTGCDFNPAFYEKGKKRLLKILEKYAKLKPILFPNATSFPPFFRELQQQMKRTTYIVQIWCNAYTNTPSTLLPINCGWILNDKRYDFDWFHGEECPEKVSDVTEADEESGEEADDIVEDDEEENSDIDEDDDSDDDSVAESDDEL